MARRGRIWTPIQAPATDGYASRPSVVAPLPSVSVRPSFLSRSLRDAARSVSSSARVSVPKVSDDYRESFERAAAVRRQDFDRASMNPRPNRRAPYASQMENFGSRSTRSNISDAQAADIVRGVDSESVRIRDDKQRISVIPTNEERCRRDNRPEDTKGDGGSRFVPWCQKGKT